MNEVITKLYEIEETAGKILKETQQYKEELQQQMILEQRSISKEMERDLERKLEKTKEELLTQAGEEIKLLEQKHQEQLDKLDETYDNHLTELAEVIVKRITEV